MVPPAIITARASARMSAKCTAGFRSKNFSDELLSLSVTQTANYRSPTRLAVMSQVHSVQVQVQVLRWQVQVQVQVLRNSSSTSTSTSKIYKYKYKY